MGERTFLKRCLSHVWPYRAASDGSLLTKDTDVDIRNVSVVEADAFRMLPFGAGVARECQAYCCQFGGNELRTIGS